jgi:hypothetical protein
MWVYARSKIFNNFGFRRTKNANIKIENLCYNPDIGKVQVQPSFILMMSPFTVDGRNTFSPGELTNLPRRIAPWDDAEAQELHGLDSLPYLRDIMVLLTTNDYANPDIERIDRTLYNNYAQSLQPSESNRPVRTGQADAIFPQKDDLVGYILGSTRYGFGRGIYYVDVVCADTGRGKTLLKAYQNHFRDKPTLLYANIEVIGFYDKLGFKIGKKCDELIAFDLQGFPRSTLPEKGAFHDKQKELARVSLQNGLGLIELTRGEACNKIVQKYREETDDVKKTEILNKYTKQRCFENVAMIYCPVKSKSKEKEKEKEKTRDTDAVYCKNDVYICRPIERSKSSRQLCKKF